MAKPKILLVDPDEKSLSMMTISLKKAGFNVTGASNGEEAWELVRTSAPDLIISDTKMPRVDGFTFCAKLKESAEFKQIPFIFLTREKSVDDKIRGLELGVDDYLTKPIYLKEVLARVKLLLEKREKEKIEFVPPDPQFSGSLADMGVVDLIQTMEMGQKSGIVYLSRAGFQASIAFNRGRIVDAQVANTRGENAVYKLLLWSDGTFRIDFRGTDEIEPTVNLSTQGLIMEGMRRIDELVRIKEQLPPLDSYLAIDSQMILEEHPDQFPEKIENILAEFTGNQTIQQVVDKLPYDDLECMEIVAKLYFQGFLMPVQENKTGAKPVEAKAEEPLFNFAPPEEESIEHIFEPEDVADQVPLPPPESPPLVDTSGEPKVTKAKPKVGKVIFLKGSGSVQPVAEPQQTAVAESKSEPIASVSQRAEPRSTTSTASQKTTRSTDRVASSPPSTASSRSLRAESSGLAQADQVGSTTQSEPITKRISAAPHPTAPTSRTAASSSSVRPGAQSPTSAQTRPALPRPPAPPQIDPEDLAPAEPEPSVNTTRRKPPAPVAHRPATASVQRSVAINPEPKRSRPLLWMLLALLTVVGVGAGAWFALYARPVSNTISKEPSLADAPVEFRDETLKLTGENLDLYRGASLDMNLDTQTGYLRAIQGFEALAQRMSGWVDGTDQEIVLSKLLLSYIRLANVQDSSQPLTKAAELLSIYKAERPNSPYLILAEAELALARGDTASAQAALNRLGSSAEKFYLFHYETGLLRLKSGNVPDLAILSLRKAVDLRPDFTLGHFELAKAYEASRRQADAAAELQKVIENSPNHAEAHYALATLALAQGDRDNAQRYAQTAVAVNDEFLPAHLVLANLLFDAGKADLALEHASTIIELATAGKQDELLAGAHKLIGKIALLRNEVERARREFELTLQIAPGDSEARQMLDSLTTPSRSVAKPVLPEKFRENPKSPPPVAAKSEPPKLAAQTQPAPAAEAAFENAQVLYRKGLLKGAVEKLQEALRQDPGHDRAWTLLGQIYIEMDKEDEALKALQKAIAINPRNAEAHVNLGGLYDAMGDGANALKEYKMYLSLDPNGKYAKDIRQLLETRK